MKIAVVTGASSGMGRECVIQLADRFGGLDEIWVIARRKDRLDELDSQVPVRLRKFSCDITDSGSIDYIKDCLDKEKPEIRILVNAAGYGKIGKIEKMKFEDGTGMIRLNCEALCAMTKITLPYIADNSRIIQFASSAAFLPQPYFAIYAATKSFVLSYSRALGVELRNRGIKVTAVCPGPVNTEFFTVAEEHDKIPFYKKFIMSDPKKVVSLAIRDSLMGKTTSIYGFMMKALYISCKIVPHDIILAFFKS